MPAGRLSTLAAQTPQQIRPAMPVPGLRGAAGGPIPNSMVDRLARTAATAADLGNARTRFDMDLDRERLDLDKAGAEFDRTRTSALDQFEQQKYGDTRTEKQARLAMEQASHAKDLEARDRQSKLNDELLAMARGDASPLAPVSAATSTPQQLGILTTPPAGASMPVSDGMALGRTQVQDRAAQRTSGALRNLEGQMIDRGILGSNLHGNRIGEVVAGQAGDLLDADVEMMLAEQDRMAEVEDRDTALNFQRQESALDRGERRRLSLLDLLQGVRY